MNTHASNIWIAMVACGLACVSWTTFAGATTMQQGAQQSMTQVSNAATQALREHYQGAGNRVVVSASPANSRIKLPACPGSLIATVPDRATPSSMMTVQVKCSQAGSWIVRVPLRLQLFRSVLVTSRALQRGDGIRPGDVSSQERDITRLGYGYIDSLSQIEGRILARPLVSGSVLTPAAMGGRRMVRAGDHVELIARSGGIEVRATAVALGGGDNGARLEVRNDSSGRVIDAVVSAPGVVQALP